MTLWHPFHDEPRAATAGRLAVLGGQLALDRAALADVSRPRPRAAVEPHGPIEDRLVERITTEFPEDGLLTAGGIRAVGHGRDTDAWWLVGPVDGRSISGRVWSEFAVSIGVFRGGIPVAGAVHAPVADRLFTASAGRGAWLNGRRLLAPSTPLSDGSAFSVRTPLDGDLPSFVTGWLRRYRWRRVGSVALELCSVAMGGLSFVHDDGASLLDLAGGAAILLEAGGLITGVDRSSPFPVHPASYRGEPIAFIAGNQTSHAEALDDVAAALALLGAR